MQARWHRRIANLTLVVSALLLLSASESVARNTNGFWRLVDDGPTELGARQHSTLIYDASKNRLIMFGGDTPSGGAYNDVWAYPLPCGPWVELFPDADTPCSDPSRPCRRHGHVAAYFPSPPRMLIHGGKLENNCVINDTWQLTLGSGPTWTRLWASTTGGPGPLERWHSAMVVWNGQARIYGGLTPSGSCGGGGYEMCDSWYFDEGGAVPDWTHSTGPTTPLGTIDENSPCRPPMTIPEIRYGHSMMLDTSANMFVTFGGVYEGGVGTSNAWKCCGWQVIGDAPGPDPGHPEGYSRAYHTATYDPVEPRMIVIGGYRVMVPEEIRVSAVTSMSLSSTNYGTWSTLSPTGSGPGKISDHAAVYDPIGDRILVFGGVDQNGQLRNDLWALDFAADATPPAAVSNLAFTSVVPYSATVQWTARGDDGTTGLACSYDLRYSQTAINGESSFAGATPHTGEPAPAAPGTVQSTTVGGLATGLQYFAMKTIDESGNSSALSNVILTCIPDVTSPDVTPPSAVSNLAFTGVTPHSATIRWTAPGDDGTTCTAASYNIRYSESPITNDATFAAATAHTGAPNPAMAGTLQSTTISGLTSGLTYYFAMKTVDDHSNVSALSNVINICIPYTPNTLCDEFTIQLPEGENREETSFGINDLGPQLASSPLQVSFGLSRSGPVTIEMFDVTGRRVARTDLADLAPGEYTRSLSTESRLAAGVYVVRLRQGSSATTRRVVLLQQ